MKIEYIANQVRETVKKYDETDPVRLAKAMNIYLRFDHLGTAPGCIKGFFAIISRIKHITINYDLPEELQKVILAHEIGHVVLHKKEAQMSAFHELELFDNVDQKEYEANIFASELLLSNEDVMDAINEDQFFFDAARQLCVPPEMLDFKVSAKYCYAAHESRLHQNDRCKRFALCLVLTVRFRSLTPWGKLFQLFI